MTKSEPHASAPTPEPYRHSELVFGLVAPVGTKLDVFEEMLERNLVPMGYTLNRVRLSKLAEAFRSPQQAGVSASEREFDRISRLMTLGTSLQANSGRGDFLALAAAQAINAGRGNDRADVRPKTVHVVRSLKHPDEAFALRRIYGIGFYLLGVVVGTDERERYLRDDKGCSDAEAATLLARDEHEEDQEFGQRTRDTFHLADAFVRLEEEDELRRFLNLIFGYPFSTPTLDEYAMFLAFTSSLRSADLSRQVGAVVVSAAGDVVAVGANDVPRAGGGLYWPGESDKRDHVLGEDFNEREREKILSDVLSRLLPPGEDEADWATRGRKLLTASPIMDMTEYGRAVHAEIEAILSCARSGISPRGGTLYSTTFPCHNCAKHIVASGLNRVVYVEPYPKSRALDLFADSISPKAAPDRVSVEPFEGIGPRRFLDLFSMTLSSGYKMKRKKDGRSIPWEAASSFPRIPLLPNTYVDRERAATDELFKLTTTETTEGKP